MPDLRIDPDAIRSGLRDEMVDARKQVVFDVDDCERVPASGGDVLWRLSLKVDERSRRRLQEDLEGQSAWWAGPPRGTADVLAVLPEQGELILRFCTTPPPLSGPVFVYPPEYLEALHEQWLDPAWSTACVDWATRALSSEAPTLDHPTADRTSQPLRTAQRESFRLLRWPASFLWGPPGTGKTYTLGALVAGFVSQFPGRRVLLFSSTNTAVDQALVAVDEALRHVAGGEPLRQRCKRVGQQFRPSHYEGHEHLLPQSDPTLLRRLAELEGSRPENSSPVDLDRWKREVQDIRRRLRVSAADVLASAGVAAMTTTAAAYLLEVLRGQATYDLVVFDEASQVGIAHALCFAPLGRRVLFAGDPQQLEPIVQSESSDATEYLGRSMFSYRQALPEATCFLNEQSRMAAPICRVVSEAFYGGKLKVAADASSNAAWCDARKPTGPGVAGHTLHVANGMPPGQWSASYGGPIRFESAVWIADHMDDLTDSVPEGQVVVVTPYRAQRRLIREKLRGKGFKKVDVATVHKFQGSERHTVVFDPVDGTGAFYQLHGERLTTVALSRAQARLLILTSDRDLASPVLRRVCELMGQAMPVTRPQHLRPIGDVAARGDFPACALGRTYWFDHPGFAGRVDRIDGDRFFVRCQATGVTKTFMTAVFRQRYGASSVAEVSPVKSPSNPTVTPVEKRKHSSGARLVTNRVGRRPR